MQRACKTAAVGLWALVFQIGLEQADLHQQHPAKHAAEHGSITCTSDPVACGVLMLSIVCWICGLCSVLSAMSTLSRSADAMSAQADKVYVYCGNFTDGLFCSLHPFWLMSMSPLCKP